jgi:hypothetical protein
VIPAGVAMIDRRRNWETRRESIGAEAPPTGIPAGVAKIEAVATRIPQRFRPASRRSIAGAP